MGISSNYFFLFISLYMWGTVCDAQAGFCTHSSNSKFLSKFQTRTPPPQWKTSDLRWPKFTPEYPSQWKTSDLRWPKFTLESPSPNEKLQIWDHQSLLWNTPQMKNFRFEMTNVYCGIPPPPMKNFRFEMTKVYSGIPPPNENFRFEMTKVYSGISPPP